MKRVILESEMANITPDAIEKQFKILKRFVDVYCRKHHDDYDNGPCSECCDLIEYSRQRLIHCPHDPKPKCKDCPSHCYKPEYRQKIKDIMRYSGIYFVKRGRLDWLVKYFFMKNGG